MSDEKDKERSAIFALFRELRDPTLKGKLTINFSFVLNGKEHNITKSVEDPYDGIWDYGDETDAYVYENENFSHKEIFAEIQEECLSIFAKEVKAACNLFDKFEEKYQEDCYTGQPKLSTVPGV